MSFYHVPYHDLTNAFTWSKYSWKSTYKSTSTSSIRQNLNVWLSVPFGRTRATEPPSSISLHCTPNVRRSSRCWITKDSYVLQQYLKPFEVYTLFYLFKISASHDIERPFKIKTTTITGCANNRGCQGGTMKVDFAPATSPATSDGAASRSMPTLLCQTLPPALHAPDKWGEAFGPVACTQQQQQQRQQQGLAQHTVYVRQTAVDVKVRGSTPRKCKRILKTIIQNSEWRIVWSGKLSVYLVIIGWIIITYRKINTPYSLSEKQHSRRISNQWSDINPLLNDGN